MADGAKRPGIVRQQEWYREAFLLRLLAKRPGDGAFSIHNYEFIIDGAPLHPAEPVYRKIFYWPGYPKGGTGNSAEKRKHYAYAAARRNRTRFPFPQIMNRE